LSRCGPACLGFPGLHLLCAPNSSFFCVYTHIYFSGLIEADG
jgi:hypothetical protein